MTEFAVKVWGARKWRPSWRVTAYILEYGLFIPLAWVLGFACAFLIHNVRTVTQTHTVSVVHPIRNLDDVQAALGNGQQPFAGATLNPQLSGLTCQEFPKQTFDVIVCHR